MREFIHGMDISSMDEVVRLGGKFYDKGQEEKLVDILKTYGVNYIRLRLWVDPYTEEGVSYGAGSNDLQTTVKMAEEVKTAGLKYLLDFHYSDFWADPGKQIKPKAWKDYNDGQLENAIFEYTQNTLKLLKEKELFPDMVQVGNEITNGLLWPNGKKPDYDAIACFVNAGIRGVRAVDADIPVMLHLDHGDDHEMCRDWFDRFIGRGEEFQIIGLSFYPVWNGAISGLIDNMNLLAKRYGKQIVVAEVSQPFTMGDYASYEKLAPQERKGAAAKPILEQNLEYPATKEGQALFMKKLVEEIKTIENDLGIGYFYWEPAWLPVKGSGWATKESLTYMRDAGPCGNEWANQALFDYDGNVLTALETIGSF